MRVDEGDRVEAAFGRPGQRTLQRLAHLGHLLAAHKVRVSADAQHRVALQQQQRALPFIQDRDEIAVAIAGQQRFCFVQGLRRRARISTQEQSVLNSPMQGKHRQLGLRRRGERAHGRGGEAKKVPLRQRHTETNQLGQFGGGFQAFGDDPGIDAVGGGAYHLDDGRLRPVGVAAGDEGPVELHKGRSKLQDVLQAGVARAGIVDGQHAALRFDPGDPGPDGLVVRDRLFFRDLYDHTRQIAEVLEYFLESL